MANIVGQILLNQFRVDAFVASGGMGAVYRVWDLKRNVPLAMKVLHADLADDPSIFKRFQREANALKKLAHPNIVPFYGLYQTQDFAFLLERFVDGPSLKEILRERQGRPLAVEEALAYLKALSAALGYAHANGVVHCDVKPGNVMVDRGGNIYLTDFGVARHAESTTTTLGAAGTPAYMAPEQIRGEAVSPATDVYALGVMLFEMLTGQRPFRGDEQGTESAGPTAGERIRYAHLHYTPPDPHSINAMISISLANVILKALAKKPEDRYHSMQEFFGGMVSATGWATGTIVERVVIPDKTLSPGYLPAGEDPHDRPPGRGIPAADQKKVKVGWESGFPRLEGRGFWLMAISAVIILVAGMFLSGKLSSSAGRLQQQQLLNSPESEIKAVKVSTELIEDPYQVNNQHGNSSPAAVVSTQSVDPALISTAAAQTVVAQLTLAAGIGPTESPVPTSVPTETVAPPPEVIIEQTILGNSAGGREISMTMVGYEKGIRAIVVIGAIDGTQTDTADMIDRLIEQYSSDPDLVPPDTLFLLIPVINPDGYSKNSRYNDHGVDLNRNWKTANWRSDPPVPGATSGKEGAGGSDPFSEPETRALEGLFVELLSTRENVVFVVFHSSVQRSSGEIFPSYTSTGLHTPSEALARELGEILGYKYSTVWDYATPGEAISWAADHGIPSIDIVWPKGKGPGVGKMVEALAATLD